MYKSPIEIISQEMKTCFDEDCVTAIQRYGITVDKDELIRALQYDRHQYEAGYNAAKAEIVHCKDCIHSYQHGGREDEPHFCRLIAGLGASLDDNDFCSHAERRKPVFVIR